MQPNQSRHAEAAATMRAFGEAAGAERVVLLVDEGDAVPATMLEWTPEEGVVVDGEAAAASGLGSGGGAAAGRRVRPPAPPRVLPRVVAVPPTALTVDAATGELSAPLGAMEQLAVGLLALAAAFGGERSVATADLPTRDPGQSVTLAGRPGEPVVVAIGDERFAMPEGWPPDRRSTA